MVAGERPHRHGHHGRVARMSAKRGFKPTTPSAESGQITLFELDPDKGGIKVLVGVQELRGRCMEAKAQGDHDMIAIIVLCMEILALQEELADLKSERKH